MTTQEPVAQPRAVRELAARLGAMNQTFRSTVMLRQRGTMREHPEGKEMRFRATETISLRRTEFEWRARTGPSGSISITDSLRDGEAHMEVRVFGLLRIAGVRGGAAAAKGAVMRYLAELAWAPDAIFHNRSLVWTVADERALCVSTGPGEGHGEVRLRLDEDGRIGSVEAEDRPRKEGSGFVERPWRGRFFDYREYQGRWLPFAAEVGWILNGQLFTAWRGEMLDWIST